MTICDWNGCERRATKRGFCNSHYERLRLSGAIRVERRGQVERFWSKVTKGDACWLWSASRSTANYGRVHFDGRLQQAHRVAYELLVGPIPEGLHLDHLCRNPPCVNPAHLEPVTPGENNLRGVGPAAVHARAAQCKWGHPLEGPNVHIDAKGWRHCRACGRESSLRDYYKSKRETVELHRKATCTFCGDEFTQSPQHRTLCSVACRVEAGRKSAREHQRRKRSGA